MTQTEARFDFSAFPELITDRLRLRALHTGDAEALATLYAIPDVMRFLNYDPADSPEKARGLIQWFQQMYDNRENVQWAIVLSETDAFIGMCGTYHWERDNRRVDLGYLLHPDHWGKGFATEAARAITRWCFEALGVHRVQADCTEGNDASARVLMKCGFTHEGTWRESAWEQGRFVNVQQFGVLRREFLGEE